MLSSDGIKRGIGPAFLKACSADRLRVLGIIVLISGAALAASGCTVQPLYAAKAPGTMPAGALAPDLAAVRGRISIASADTRSAQVVRNELLFRLNGGGGTGNPLYSLRVAASGDESVVAIQQGSGIPAASLYRMMAKYQLVRLADTKVIASGTRYSTVPFDRTQQFFAASRALLEARDRSGRDVADEVALAVLAEIAKDLRTAPPAPTPAVAGSVLPAPPTAARPGGVRVR